MEKEIVYIIGGILYFLYLAWKKSNEEQKRTAKPVPQSSITQDSKPQSIKPTFSSTIEEIRQEIKQRQAAFEAQNKPVAPAPKMQTAFQKVTPPKDLFIHEKKKATFGQGAGDAPVYEDDAAVATTIRDTVRLKNDGAYKVETMEEAHAQAANDNVPVYEFDAKQAFIGSVIFEQKF